MENSERKKRFDNYISNKALEGYIIVDKNQENLSAVLKKDAEKVNHTLHAILTLITCLWGIVWIIKYNQAGKESRIRISIDDSGNMVEEKVG